MHFGRWKRPQRCDGVESHGVAGGGRAGAGVDRVVELAAIGCREELVGGDLPRLAEVAAGVAAGAFTSFTPFMGLHFLFAALFAWAIRGNLLASALGTFVGNPLTFPFIWAATSHQVYMAAASLA